MELSLVILHETRIITRLDLGNGTLDCLAVFMQPPEIIGRVIDAGGDALRTKGIKNFLGNIAMKRRMHDAEWRRCRIKHCKAGVMFGRKHYIPNSCKMRETG